MESPTSPVALPKSAEAAAALAAVSATQGRFRALRTAPTWMWLVLGGGLGAVLALRAAPAELAWLRNVSFVLVISAMIAAFGRFARRARFTDFTTRFDARTFWAAIAGVLILNAGAWVASSAAVRSTGWTGWFVIGGLIVFACYAGSAIALTRRSARGQRIDL